MKSYLIKILIDTLHFKLMDHHKKDKSKQLKVINSPSWIKLKKNVTQNI
jgi:hypothetical protein